MNGEDKTDSVKKRNRWPVIFVVFVVVFIAAFLLWRGVLQGGPTPESHGPAGKVAVPEQKLPALKPDPAKLYAANCALCHGDNLQGRGSIPALHSPKWNYAGKNAELVKIIYAGKGSRMPAFNGRLSNSQIEALAAWLQERNATAKKVP